VQIYDIPKSPELNKT